MDKIYGVYTRSLTQEKWHWKKECPDYPQDVINECMISTKPLPLSELCALCFEIDISLYTPFQNKVL